jgi:hypothetical protein
VNGIVEMENETHLPSASSFNGGFAADEDMVVKMKRIDGLRIQVTSHATHVPSDDLVFSLYPTPSTTVVPSLSLLVRNRWQHEEARNSQGQIPSTVGIKASPHFCPASRGRFNRLYSPKFQPMGESVCPVCSNQFVDNLTNSYM